MKTLVFCLSLVWHFWSKRPPKLWRYLIIILNGILFMSCFTSCTKNMTGRQPVIKLASATGSSEVLNFEPQQVENALTNAFDMLNYHEMPFIKVTNSEWDYLASNWHPTNGYILYEGNSTAGIPLDTGVNVPYRATFYINLEPLNNTKQTKITVRTMQAEVIDGQEQGVHGGRANHSRAILPVQQEEEMVIRAVLKELDGKSIP